MSKNAVVFTVAGRHIQLTATAIYSLITNYHSTQELDILVVAGRNTISNAGVTDMQQMPRLMNKPQIQIFFWAPPASSTRVDSNLKNSNRYPNVTTWRLLLPKYFSARYEYLIYLDNDVLVLDDINKLIDLEGSNSAISAVQDMHFLTFQDRFNETDENMRIRAHDLYNVDSYESYVNSGMVIFNVAEFNRLVDEETIISLINEDQYLFLDQTILNILMKGKINYLPFRYNFQVSTSWLKENRNQISNDKHDLMLSEREQVVILHLTGKYSPFFYLSISDADDKLFMNYFLATKRALQQLFLTRRGS